MSAPVVSAYAHAQELAGAVCGAIPEIPKELAQIVGQYATFPPLETPDLRTTALFRDYFPAKELDKMLVETGQITISLPAKPADGLKRSSLLIKQDSGPLSGKLSYTVMSQVVKVGPSTEKDTHQVVRKTRIASDLSAERIADELLFEGIRLGNPILTPSGEVITNLDESYRSPRRDSSYVLHICATP